MSWSDIFIPSTSQTSDEQAANYARQQAEYQRKLEARQAAGTISDEAYNRGLELSSLTLNDQDAAAWEGAKEGAREGLNNILDFPGKATDAVGNSLTQVLWGIIKGIPWWAWFVGLGALFVWMGGLTLLRGRLAKA